MRADQVHAKTKAYWDDVTVLEKSRDDHKAKAKSLDLQIDAKMAKIRKLGTSTEDQMRQLDFLDVESDPDDKPAKKASS